MPARGIFLMPINVLAAQSPIVEHKVEKQYVMIPLSCAMYPHTWFKARLSLHMSIKL